MVSEIPSFKCLSVVRGNTAWTYTLPHGCSSNSTRGSLYFSQVLFSKVKNSRPPSATCKSAEIILLTNFRILSSLQISFINIWIMLDPAHTWSEGSEHMVETMTSKDDITQLGIALMSMLIY